MFNWAFKRTLRNVVAKDLEEAKFLLYEAEQQAAFQAAMVKMYSDTVDRLNEKLKAETEYEAKAFKRTIPPPPKGWGNVPTPIPEPEDRL